MWIEAKIRTEIRVAIEALRNLENEAFGSRHGKTDFYKYLDGVFRLLLKWRTDGKSKKRARQVASIYEVKLRNNTHPIRVIIDASSAQNREIKSRWTRALQFALKHRAEVVEMGLMRFLERNGGVDGCARRIAQKSPRREKVTVRAAA